MSHWQKERSPFEGLQDPQFAKNVGIGMAYSEFNWEIVENLLFGALWTCKLCGIPDANVRLLKVPGAFEIPLAAQAMAGSEELQPEKVELSGILALGAIVEGDTPHFDYLSQAVSHGLMQTSLEMEIPISFGVLTTNTLEQAQKRSFCADELMRSSINPEKVDASYYDFLWGQDITQRQFLAGTKGNKGVECMFSLLETIKKLNPPKCL